MTSTTQNTYREQNNDGVATVSASGDDTTQLTFLVYDRGSWWETPPGGREPVSLASRVVMEKYAARGDDGYYEADASDLDVITIRPTGRPVVLQYGPGGLVAWNNFHGVPDAITTVDVGILSASGLDKAGGFRRVASSFRERIDGLVACGLLEIVEETTIVDTPSYPAISNGPERQYGHIEDDGKTDTTPRPPARPVDLQCETGSRRPRVMASWDVVAHGLPLSLGGLLAFARTWQGGFLSQLYDIHLSYDHIDLLEELRRDSSPAIILLSNYLWSEETNMELARQVKDLNEEHLVVLGGTYVPNPGPALENFLQIHTYLDVVAHGEGEITLVEALAAMEGHPQDVSTLSSVSGLTIRIDDAHLHTGERALHPNLEDFPSPYLSGEFDHIDRTKLQPLLGQLEIPGIETDRGCPYSCSFCISGVSTIEKLRKFPIERVFAELRWCAERDISTFFIIDANFGIHPRDVDIARELVRLKRDYGAPSAIVLSYAKHAVKRVAEIVHLLNAGGITSIGALALQTRDAGTLDNVNRSNIRPEIYGSLAAEFQRDGLPLFTDLIIGLPGQTVDTFLTDLQYCIDHELTPRIFPAVSVRNTEMDSPEFRDRFGIVTGDRNLIIETSTFSRCDRDQMMRLRMAYRCFEHFGILRHVFRYIQWDHGIDAADQLERIERVVRESPDNYPLLSWVLGYLDIFLTVPFSWSSLYDEVCHFLHIELGIEDDSALRTVVDVQIALMPAPSRQFPHRIGLDHDYLAWFSARDLDDASGLTPQRPRLTEFGSEFFEVKGDRYDRCGGAMRRLVAVRPPQDVVSDFWAGLHWELESPLERVFEVSSIDFSTLNEDDGFSGHMGVDDPVPVTIGSPRSARLAGAGQRETVVREAPGWGPWRSGDRPSGPEGFGVDAVEHTVGERFFLTADIHSERLALTSPSGNWTYAELARRVGAIAGGIQLKLGVQTGVPVAVMLDHDGPLVAAVLGVMCAGQIVVVLDPTTPGSQMDVVMSEASPLLLISDERCREAAISVAASTGCEHVAVEELRGSFDGPQPLGRHAPAMLAFTSGTTGVPKGAIINHGVLLSIVRGATDVCGVGPDDRMALLFPLSLPISAYPMFIPLLTGGSLATLDLRAVGLAPLAHFLVSERITFTYLAPTIVRFVAESIAGESFPDLRIVALVGEVVDADMLKLMYGLFGCEYVAVAYGTTETGVVSIAVYRGDVLPDDEVSCGYSVDDMECRILDRSGIPLGKSEVGEIAVVSDRLFDGYWGHPELDGLVVGVDEDERFDRRMYRTGDLGRFDVDGALVVLGRDDTKVKIRGRFVVLGDVEADLRDLDGVVDAAVVCRSLGGVPELVAYVVSSDRESASPTVWRSRLLARSEAYRIPTRWILLDEFPRLPNGKLDRRSLPEPEATVGERAAVRSKHSVGDDLCLVRDVWEELLPGVVIDVDDEFMALGGDSLLAAQMLVILESRSGVMIPMGDLVHARTARQLTEALRQRREQQANLAESTVSCVQGGDESSHPILWFVHDLHGSAYRVRHVAAELGSGWPVWSFESPLLAGERNLHRSMETFAARYLTDMREVQPHGPYWLAGYSFGGFCAYEMARQLRAADEVVAFLGIIDAGPGFGNSLRHRRRSPLRPWFGVAPPPPAGSDVREAVDHYRRMCAEGPLRVARHLMVRSGVFRFVDPARFELDLRRFGRVRPEWRLWYSWEEHWKLVVNGWNPSSFYSGRLDLFWASQSPSEDASMGWEPHAQDLIVHRFAGDHDGVLEPRGAPMLASALRGALDEVRHAPA